MSQQDGVGDVQPLGGQQGDDLGDLKIKRGGGVLIPILFIVVLLGVGGAAFWYFAMREDPTVAHEAFRREIFGPVHGQYYNEFWACALNEPLSNFSNNTELMAKIGQNAGGGDAKRYGQHLLESENCLPLLNKGIPEYRAIKSNPATPPDYYPLLDELAGSLEGVQKAWTQYAEFQSKADKRADLRNRIKARGEHWVGYQSSTNNRVADKIAHYTPSAVMYHQYISCVLGDTSFTSFSGEEGMSAQDQLLGVLDKQCAQNRANFLQRLETTCRDKLYPTVPPAPDESFEDAVRHWSKVENDFGSALPMIECLEEYEEAHVKTLTENIAKSWYGFSKAYRSLIELSKAKSGGGLPGAQ